METGGVVEAGLVVGMGVEVVSDGSEEAKSEVMTFVFSGVEVAGRMNSRTPLFGLAGISTAGVAVAGEEMRVGDVASGVVSKIIK